MPKRKAESDLERPPKKSQPSQAPSAPTKSYGTRLERILDEGKQLVVQATKLCQRFERQKLGRRSYTARVEKDDKEIQRIDEEIQALNTLDVDDAIDRHVKKILLKIKSIVSSGKLPESLTTQTFQPLDRAAANVTARLYKAKQVKAAMDSLVEAVRREITKNGPSPKSEGLKDIPTEGIPESEQAPGRALESNEESLSNGIAGSEIPHRPNGAIQPAFLAKFEDETKSTTDTLDPVHKQGKGNNNGSENIEDDPDQSNDSNNTTEMKALKVRAPKPTMKLVSSRAMSLSPPPSLSDSVSDEVGAHKTSARAVRSSTFLPSLTTGGYISRSDSEASDINGEIAPRKNRRGQRARQAIAERKFGANAKHLQQSNTKSKGSGRNEGWDAKRGAVSARHKGIPDRAQGARRWGALRSAEAEYREARSKAVENKGREITERRQDDSGPIHPSWAARKQAKAKEKQSVKAFVGKKIVFD
jgi:BUD22 domain-containing protein